MPGDRAHHHELPGRPGNHLGAVVGHREQDRAGLVVDGEVDGAVVVAGLDPVEQPPGLQAAVKASSTWVEVSSTETTSVSHLRETRSAMMSTAIPAAVKCVVS